MHFHALATLFSTMVPEGNACHAVLGIAIPHGLIYFLNRSINNQCWYQSDMKHARYQHSRIDCVINVRTVSSETRLRDNMSDVHGEI